MSITCEVPKFHPLPKTHQAIGIDLGITDFAILSDGRKVDNQRFTAKMEQKLKREQRNLSRRYEQAKKDNRVLRDCMNYQKQRRKVARLREISGVSARGLLTQVDDGIHSSVRCHLYMTILNAAICITFIVGYILQT